MLLDLLYSEDIDIKDLEKYFLASSQGQAPGFSPKNFITCPFEIQDQHFSLCRLLFLTLCLYSFTRFSGSALQKLL